MPGRLRVPAVLAVAVLVGSCTNSNAPTPAPDARSLARDSRRLIVASRRQCDVGARARAVMPLKNS